MREFPPVLSHLAAQQLGVAPGGERHQPETVRVPAQHRQRGAPDRAGGAEDGHAPHESPSEHAERAVEHRGDGKDEIERVQPVQHTPMPRNEPAGVLDARLALEEGLRQVPDLGDY